jgi:hypothetical protein
MGSPPGQPGKVNLEPMDFEDDAGHAAPCG